MSKYDNLSKEELLKLVEKQDKELASKKYGLVWDAEREPEQVVLDCANNLPVLKRVKGKEIKTDDSEDNILIEGDNYHALTVLNYTHKGKIDVIYIDPPYNTGNKDFIYNDRFVDKTDSHPHSKWLNFMEKRLNLARNLLKDTGVIFISIDDHEMAQLKLLCDRIFGKDNFMGLVSVQSTPGGRQSSKNFAIMGDYILVYGKTSESKIYGLPLSQKRISQYNKKDKKGKYLTERLRQHGIAEKREDVPTMYFPIYYNKKGKTISLVRDKNHRIKILPILPSGGDGRWIWGKEKIEKDKNFIEIKQVKRGEKYIYNAFFKKYLDSELKEKFPTIWIEPELRTEVGTKELKLILNGEKKFSFPKPKEFIKRLICSSTKNSDSILDFFAGSGTTGHAVLELNKEDGGNRKFILCSNNENNNGYGKIMDDVCYPRVINIIKGYKKNGNGEKVDGLGGNLQYFRTGLVRKTSNKDQVRLDLTKRCVEMLCVKENIFNLKIERQDYKIFSSNKKDKFLGIYFNLFDKSFEDFLKEIKKIKVEKAVYIFSLDNEVNKSLFSGIDNLKIKAIPQEILDVYDKIIKMNIPVKAEIIFTLLEKAKKRTFEENDKDDGAKNLRIVLEKILQKIAQMNGIEIYNDKQKEIKISKINDDLKKEKVISQIEWEEIKTYLTIGNKASHGEFDEYDLDQIKNFAKFAQSLINKFNIQ